MVATPSGIPRALTEMPNWLCWKFEERDGKPTKVPYCATERKRAKSNDRTTWCDYATAARAQARVGYDGVGFAITTPFVGIDLDLCRDPETGAIAPWARTIIRLLNSYTEITPSGLGVHIWVRGAWTGEWNNRRGPKHGDKSEGVEVYSVGKYFTVTGTHLPGTPLEVEERPEALAKLAASPNPFEKIEKPAQLLTVEEAASALDDDALLARMFQSANGERIKRLWSGNTSDFAGDDSAADWDLIDHLLYWTDYDSIRVDRLFRRSGLMREHKWDTRHFSNGETYGAGSIRRRMERKLKTRQVSQTLPEAGPTEIINAADLQRMIFPPRVHIIPELITKGLSVLAGKSKFGKSWFILDASIAVAEGGIAAGYIQCTQGSVLYLALEDGFDRLQERMGVLIGNRPWPVKLNLATVWPTMDEPLCLTRISAWLDSTPDAKMVVIDIFQKFRPMAVRGLNMYQQDYKDAAPLHELAKKHGVAIVLLHHVNKMKTVEGDDIFDAISGSTGLPGAADTPMVIRKINKTNATLYLRGRDINETEYALIWRPGSASWTIVGDAEETALSLERREILDLFKERRAITVRFVCDELGLDNNTARQRLFRMKRDGLLLRAEDGSYVLAPNPPKHHQPGVTPVTLVTPVTVTEPENESKTTPGNAPVTPKVTLVDEIMSNEDGISGVNGASMHETAESVTRYRHPRQIEHSGASTFPLHEARRRNPGGFCRSCTAQLMSKDELDSNYCERCMNDLAEQM